MRKTFSLAIAALAAVLAMPASAAISAALQTQIVEYYNATLDHYFITADPNEQHDLDTGVHVGWARTGYAFPGFKAGATYAGTNPVCRFYGKPEAGLDSHFYTASPAECQAVKDRFPDQWQFESGEVFRAAPVDPTTGRCPADTEPVYRLWNNRADVNHRYTDQVTVFRQMVAKGYVAEGDGNPSLPVVFCVPIGTSSTPATPTSPAGSPSCTLATSSSTPAVGTMIALTSVCTGAPTSYAWTGCTSSTGTCQATSNAAGNATYTLTASNAAGAGAPASITVAWQGTSGATPVCTLSGTTTTPTVGGTLGLTANCSQTPTRYDWLECSYLLQSVCNPIPACSSTSATCTITSTDPGFAHYALQAANAAGVGARVGYDAEWQTGGASTPTAPVCSLISSDAYPLVGASVVLTASCSGSPTAYVWTGCSASGTSCSVSSASTGARTFSVVASNAVGSSAPASATVTWQAQPVPNCSVSASRTNPTVGQAVTLTASCSGSPTSWQWTGCTGSGSSCTAAENAAGPKTYSVVATNASGSGPSASTTVNWQAAPTAPPSCTVSASTTSPFTGGTVTMTASCSNQPASYTWTGCTSTSSTCVATSASAGLVTYGVAASNVVGTGVTATVDVTWQQSTAAPDFCSSSGYTDIVRVSLPWTGGPLVPSNYGGAFRANEVLVVAITVPAGAANFTSTGFSATVAEYQGAPTFRDARLSRSPCDFNRALDPTGANGPMSIGSNGTSVTVYGTVGSNMLPGQTYYISIRNWSSLLGSTCTTSTCNLIVGQMQWPQ